MKNPCYSTLYQDRKGHAMEKYYKVNIVYKNGFLTMEKDTNPVIDMVKNKKGVFVKKIEINETNETTIAKIIKKALYFIFVYPL